MRHLTSLKKIGRVSTFLSFILLIPLVIKQVLPELGPLTDGSVTSVSQTISRPADDDQLAEGAPIVDPLPTIAPAKKIDSIENFPSMPVPAEDQTALESSSSESNLSNLNSDPQPAKLVSDLKEVSAQSPVVSTEVSKIEELPISQLPEDNQDDATTRHFLANNFLNESTAGIPILSNLFANWEDSAVPQSSNRPPEISAKPVSSFSIPVSKVNTEIIHIPIENGSWNLTELDNQVGILAGGGQYPGDRLSMIFAAHATIRWPVSGPFGNLKNVHLGEQIIYSTGDTVYTYEISRFIYAHPSRVDLLFQEEVDQIVLVTCNDYNLLTDGFDKRLVAYATLVKTEEVTESDQLFD